MMFEGNYYIMIMTFAIDTKRLLIRREAKFKAFIKFMSKMTGVPKEKIVLIAGGYVIKENDTFESIIEYIDHPILIYHDLG